MSSPFSILAAPRSLNGNVPEFSGSLEPKSQLAISFSSAAPAKTNARRHSRNVMLFLIYASLALFACLRRSFSGLFLDIVERDLGDCAAQCRE